MPNDHVNSKNWNAILIVVSTSFIAIPAESFVVLLVWATGIFVITDIGRLAFAGLRKYSRNTQFVACDLWVGVIFLGTLLTREYEPELFAYVKWAAAGCTGLGFALYHVNIGAVCWYGPDLVNYPSLRWLPSWRRNPYVGATMFKRLGFLLFAVYYIDDPIIFAATAISFMVSFERILNLLHSDEKQAMRAYLRNTYNLALVCYVLMFPALFFASDVWSAIGAYASALIPVYFLILKLRISEIYDIRYWLPFLASGAGLIGFAIAMGAYPIAAYEFVAALFFVPAAVVAFRGDQRWALKRREDRERRERRAKERELSIKRREFRLKYLRAEQRRKKNRPVKAAKLRTISRKVRNRRIKKAKQGRRKGKRRPTSSKWFLRGFHFPPSHYLKMAPNF